MIAIGFLFIRALCDCFKPRRRLEAESLVLWHQLNVLQRAPRRLLHLRWVDRALFIWLYRRCPRILDAITIVRPETVVRWHRMGFDPEGDIAERMQPASRDPRNAPGRCPSICGRSGCRDIEGCAGRIQLSKQGRAGSKERPQCNRGG